MKKTHVFLTFSLLLSLFIFSCQKDGTVEQVLPETKGLSEGSVFDAAEACTATVNFGATTRSCGIQATGTSGACAFCGTTINDKNNLHSIGTKFSIDDSQGMTFLLQNVTLVSANYSISYVNSNGALGSVNFSIDAGEFAKINFNSLCVPTVTLQCSQGWIFYEKIRVEKLQVKWVDSHFERNGCPIGFALINNVLQEIHYEYIAAI